MPKRYRLITFTVEAIQVGTESVDRAAMWSGGVTLTEYDAVDRTKKFVALNVPTMDGVKRAHEGDYVVKETGGNICVVRQAEFESKYELAGS